MNVAKLVSPLQPDNGNDDEKCSGSTPDSSDEKKIEVDGNKLESTIDEESKCPEEESCGHEDSDDGSNISYGSWDYDVDPAYVEETMSYPASQPCYKRGVFYTPPGWVRKYRKRRRSSSTSDDPQEKPPTAKKLQFNQ